MKPRIPPDAKLTKEQARYAARGVALVHDLAEVAARNWPTLHATDFLSAGNEELVRAARRFEPDRGVPFEHFARRAVWGVMLDLAHHEVFTVQRVARTVTRIFADDGLADGLVERWFQDDARVVSPRAEGLASLRARAVELALASVAAHDEVPTLEEALLGQEEERVAQQRLASALAELDAPSRELLQLHFTGSTLDAIAEVQGVSKRTVQRALDRIKQRLSESLSASRSAGPEP